MRSSSLSLALAALSAVPLFAADRLFLFQAEARKAAVLETPSLRPAGAAAVPSGAFAAFQAGGEIFVAGSHSVAVLADDLTSLGEIRLSAEEATAAAQVPYDASVLVAAGGQLYRIDTETRRVDSVLHVGGEAFALCAPADERRAYWLTAGSRQVRVIDLETNTVLPGTADLAATPEVVSGGAIGSGSQVFSARPLVGGVSAASSPPAQTAVPALAAANASGARLLRSAGAFILSSADGARVANLTDPATGGAFSSALAGSAVSADGRTAYLALEDGRILAFDGAGERASATAWLASAPTALSLVANPAQGTGLAKVAGDQQAVVQGSNFTIVVSGPTGGVPMTVTSDSPAAECASVPPLSGQTVIGCTANAVTTNTTVTLTVSALDSTVTFTIFVVPAGQPDGLFIISGNNQSVGAGATFSLVVESRLNGVPQAAVPITVTETSAVLTCPAGGLTTNGSGRATIACTVAATVPSAEAAVIDVSDGTHTVSFNATIQGQSGSNDALVRVTPNPVPVLPGQSFNLTIRAMAAGAPQQNVVLTASSNNTAVQCPSQALTGINGEATLVCAAGQPQGNVSAIVTITDGARTVTFNVNVGASTPTDGLIKFSGDNQTVPPNTQFPQPLVVQAISNGQPQVNLPLAVTVAGNAVTCPTNVLTGANGLASITCTAGAPSGTPVTIQVIDATGRTVSFTATIGTGGGGNQAQALTLLSPTTLSARVGDTLAGAIRVRAETLAGMPVNGANVYGSGPQGITVTPSVAQSDANGFANFDVTFGCAAPAGQIQLGLTPTSAEAAVAYFLSAGPIAQLNKQQGDNQTGGIPGQRLAQALVVQSVDTCGTILPGAGVTWAVIPPEAATLENVISTTNAQGQASVLVRPSTRGGAYQVRATAATDGNIVANFTLTTQNTASQLQIVSGNGQTVPAQTQAPSPLTVRVTSAGGQGVQGVTVTFQVVSGSGGVGSASVVTDAQGQASTAFTAGTVRGPVAVRATSGNLTADFSLTVGGGTPQLQVPGFVNGASFLPGFVSGSTGTIFGVNITTGVSGAVAAPYDPLNGFPTLFLGVRVTVGGIPAPILGLANVNGQEQINIQVPFGLAQGTTTIIVENDGVQATIEGIPIFGAQPGIFEYALGNQLYAAVLHADYSVVTPQNPARPGEVLAAFVTGLGGVTPAVPTNQAGPASPLSTTVSIPTITLDGVPQAIQGSYYAPTLMTVYQINFRVGAATQPGSATMVISIDGSPSKAALLPVGAAF